MAIEIPTDLTPELVPLSWLLGTWEGQGRLGSGGAGSEHFFQSATFKQDGLPYLQYSAESWLTDEHGTRLRPLTVETGFWALGRKLNEADVGPGLVPAETVPALKSADEVEELRNTNGGFDITATIVHPGGIAELYYGQIKGPQIQLATDMVMRGSQSKEYSAATRMFGLVNGDLFWRWDVAAARGNELEAHASAILKKVA
ncbi:FABP family protein [Arthrobacter deserti]|uniref:Peroxynitrite isomerase n=1 Tax=Arthrobacter deserti TaxID=1742687 RepID=A0ABX1JPJ9_9MICC|nr:FABP family protein [Arthrobacter deserti]